MESEKHTTAEEIRIIWKMHNQEQQAAKNSKVLNISWKTVLINSHVESPDLLINGDIRSLLTRKADAHANFAIIKMIIKKLDTKTYMRLI